MDKPVKVLRPKLITWVLLAYYFPLTINATIFGGGAIGGVAFVLLKLSWGMPISGWSCFLVPMVVIFFGIPGFIYFINRKTYDKTEYRFYEDRLEYAEGFWTIEYKTVKYKHITEVLLRRTVIQRFYGLGTVYLSVPALAPRGGFSGVKVADVRHPEKVYQDIQEILQRYS